MLPRWMLESLTRQNLSYSDLTLIYILKDVHFELGASLESLTRQSLSYPDLSFERCAPSTR